MLTTHWTMPKRWRRLASTCGGEDSRRGVAARWAMGGHQKARVNACADSSPIRSDPFCSHIWAEKGSVGPRLSVWVGPLGWLFPIFLSAWMCSDARCPFGSARWRCPKRPLPDDAHHQSFLSLVIGLAHLSLSPPNRRKTTEHHHSDLVGDGDDAAGGCVVGGGEDCYLGFGCRCADFGFRGETARQRWCLGYRGCGGSSEPEMGGV
jgi:hypothetical protein